MSSDFQKYISSVLKSLPSDATELSLRSAAVGCKNKEDGTFLAQMLENVRWFPWNSVAAFLIPKA